MYNDSSKPSQYDRQETKTYKKSPFERIVSVYISINLNHFPKTHIIPKNTPTKTQERDTWYPSLAIPSQMRCVIQCDFEVDIWDCRDSAWLALNIVISLKGALMVKSTSVLVWWMVVSHAWESSFAVSMIIVLGSWSSVFNLPFGVVPPLMFVNRNSWYQSMNIEFANELELNSINSLSSLQDRRTSRPSRSNENAIFPFLERLQSSRSTTSSSDLRVNE